MRSKTREEFHALLASTSPAALEEEFDRLRWERDVARADARLLAIAFCERTMPPAGVVGRAAVYMVPKALVTP